MLVAVQHDVHAVRVQRVPESLVLGVADDDDAGHEARLVPVGERALLAVQRQVGAQPLHLCSRRCDVELAVERDDVPVAQVVAVVALGWIARDSAEVTEVAWRGTVRVLVVTGYGPGTRLVTPPRGVVPLGVVGAGAHRVGVVTEGEHRAGDAVEQVGGEGIALGAAVGDIAGADEDRRAGRIGLHGEHVAPGQAEGVGERDAHAVQADGGVDVRSRDRGRRARRGAARRAAVAPGHRVSPGGVVRARIAERGRDPDRVARGGGEVGAGVHSGRRGARAVAAAAARVARGLARHRDELPRVRPVAERELQDAIHAADPCLAVRNYQRIGGVEPLASRTHHELADPGHRIGDTRGRLGREPLVVTHVRVDDQRRMPGDEVVPERLYCRGRRERARRRRVEARAVPHGEDALLRGRGEIGLEPRLLRRAERRRDVAVVAVEDDDVPGAEIVAVIALGGVSRGGTEVAEIPGRRGARVVIVVPRPRIRARLVAAPARVVAVLVVGRGAVRIGAVAEREHRPRDRVEDSGRGLVVGAVAARDVARAYEGNGVRHGRGHQRHRGPPHRGGGTGSLTIVAGGSGQQGRGQRQRREQPRTGQGHEGAAWH